MEFVFPEGGALLWIDNMLVPVGAQNPVGAAEIMDFYYDPEIATKLTEWILYMSPVPEDAGAHQARRRGELRSGVQGVRQQARGDGGEPVPVSETRSSLSRTSFGFGDWTDETAEEWDAIFLPISQG